jgi:hypothetical protein
VASYFKETWDSLREQHYGDFEWLVLAQGSLSEELEAVIQGLEREPRCRILRQPVNLGIVRGLRYCLERAVADYVVPLDGDDLITPDALHILAHYILRNGNPPFLYSDEDHLVDGSPSSPFLRPDWDPVLALNSSYVWHLCAIRRERAVELGAYGDEGANWCHDWDSLLRFTQAGDRILHVPEILHHWRAHTASSTNRADPESGSLKSQQFVLNRYIKTCLDTQLFEVKPFPIFRGATEFWLRRMRVQGDPMDIVVCGGSKERSVAAICALLRNARYRFGAVHLVGVEVAPGDLTHISDLLTNQQTKSRVHCWPNAQPQNLGEILAATDARYAVICDERVYVKGSEWPWECDGLFRCHRDLVAVAARILDGDGKIVGGAEILGFEGVSGCPDAGRKADDPGYFAMALKPRCVSAPTSELFAARVDFLREAADSLSGSSWSSIASWLGAIALQRHYRIAVTPLFDGVLRHNPERIHMRPTEVENFLGRFGTLLPDTRWYSHNFAWSRHQAYSLQTVTSGVSQSI